MPAQKNTSSKKLPLFCRIVYLLTGISVILYICFTQSSGFADWFNQNVSHHGRRLLALLTAWIPFSLAELLICLIPFLLVLLTSIGIRRYCDSNRSAFVFVGILLSAFCIGGIIFVWNFAAGYYGSTLDKNQFGLETSLISGLMPASIASFHAVSVFTTLKVLTVLSLKVTVTLPVGAS